MNIGIRMVYAAAACLLVAALKLLALANLDRALLAVVAAGAHWPAAARRAINNLLPDSEASA